MYADARRKPMAASGPKERDYPFSTKSEHPPSKGVKNDSVGSEVYKANPYGVDDRRNWVDRS